MAAKYAMLRWGIACRAITLERVGSEDQIADIMTKPLTGPAFHALRARVLGLPHDHESPAMHTLRTGVLRYSRGTHGASRRVSTAPQESRAADSHAKIHDISPEGAYDISPSGCS